MQRIRIALFAGIAHFAMTHGTITRIILLVIFLGLIAAHEIARYRQPSVFPGGEL